MLNLRHLPTLPSTRPAHFQVLNPAGGNDLARDTLQPTLEWLAVTARRAVEQHLTEMGNEPTIPGWHDEHQTLVSNAIAAASELRRHFPSSLELVENTDGICWCATRPVAS